MNETILICRICNTEVSYSQKLCPGSSMHLTAKTKLCYNEHGITSTRHLHIEDEYNLEDEVFTARIWHQKNPVRQFPEKTYKHGVNMKTVKVMMQNVQE